MLKMESGGGFNVQSAVYYVIIRVYIDTLFEVSAICFHIHLFLAGSSIS